METVCAVVVTFNRKKLLLETIESLLRQTIPLKSIYIIDNASTDGTKELLFEKNIIKKSNSNVNGTIKNVIKISNNKRSVDLYYLQLDSNTGGSGGFYEGVKRSYEMGYDWLWLMDDDAEPADNCLEELLNASEMIGKEKISFVSPLIIQKNSKEIQNYHHKRMDNTLTREKLISIEEIEGKEMIKIDANAFVGPLISTKGINRIGFPEKDFFIWLDDTEYTHRLTREKDGYLVTKAIIYHKDIPAIPQFFVKNYWKTCYGIRNRLLWINSYNKGINQFKGNMIIFYTLFKLVLKVLIQSKWKKNRVLVIKNLCLAFTYGISGKGGKFIDPVEYIKSVR